MPARGSFLNLSFTNQSQRATVFASLPTGSILRTAVRLALWKARRMKYSDNDIIINEYRDAFHKYAKSGIIDMDVYLKHSFSFQIHRLEDIVTAWDGTIPAYRQSQFLITLVKKGTGEETVGHFSFPIQANTLLVVPQRIPHSSQYSSLDCSGFMLSFDIDFFFKHFFPKSLIANKRIFRKSAKPFMILTNEQAEGLSAIFEYLLHEYHEQLPNKDEMIAVKVLELLVLCDRLFVANTQSPEFEPYSEVIDSFVELVQNHCKAERSVQFYANALHVHPNYLNFLIRKYSGMTAKQTIADHLFLEAKGLLGSPSLHIKEISFMLGFATAGAFSSFFKKMSNMSPSQYRQGIL
jgi:AraC family transcriptional activator of pobA